MDKRSTGSSSARPASCSAPARALYVMQQTSLGLGEPTIAQGKLYRIPLHGERTLTKFWQSRPMDLPDGFSFARSGRIYVANAGSNQLVVLDRGVPSRSSGCPRYP